MIILGIETSCDETAAAVVANGTKILSNVVASSADIHIKTGGIIPEQAARQQVKSIIPVIEQSLSNAFNNKSPTTNYQLLTTKIDAIAVTTGPGLIGSLLVGVETAKTLSYLWKKPIIPVNHLAAHIYANWLNEENQPKFPALALVVSGGHTDLVIMSGHGKLTWIGGTRDDAAGEAFDKTARLLGLGYPGGPEISSSAEKYLNQSPVTNHQSLSLFPRPMINEENYDWSFSGLKTAVSREVKEKQSLPHRGKRLKAKDRQMLAAEIQEAIVDVLVEKTLRAAKKFKPKSLLLSGGVAANKRLTEKFITAFKKTPDFQSGDELNADMSSSFRGNPAFQSGEDVIGRIKDEKLQVFFHVPHSKLCTDNATYIASHAYFNYVSVDWRKIKANPQLTIVGEV